MRKVNSAAFVMKKKSPSCEFSAYNINSINDIYQKRESKPSVQAKVTWDLISI